MQLSVLQRKWACTLAVMLVVSLDIERAFTLAAMLVVSLDNERACTLAAISAHVFTIRHSYHDICTSYFNAVNKRRKTI